MAYIASASTIAVNDGKDDFAGPGVASFTVTTPGLYFFSGQSNPVPASGATITLKQNGSTITSSSSIVGDGGGLLSSSARVMCAAADVLTVTTTCVASPTIDVDARAMKTIAAFNLLASGS